MKDKAKADPAQLSTAELDDTLRRIRKWAPLIQVPATGWVRAIREALGMTNVELARRLGKAPQSVEDMQKSEQAGSIKLESLRTLAEGLGCQLVYAVVPPKSFAEMRQEQAHAVARRVVEGIFRSVDPISQRRLSNSAGEKELDKLIKRVLTGKSKITWK